MNLSNPSRDLFDLIRGDPKDDIHLVISRLSNYLWEHLELELLKKNILKENLYRVIVSEFSLDVNKWLNNESTWDFLLDKILKYIRSDNIKGTFIFLLNPSGYFGLPQEGKTVVPSTSEYSYSPAIDSWAMEIVGHGSLSEYRQENDKITYIKKYNDVNIRIEDNYLHINIVGNNPNEILNKAYDFVNNFIHINTLMFNILLSFELKVSMDNYGRRIPIVQYKELISTTLYSLNNVTDSIKNSINIMSIYENDMILQKSLEYFNHAKVIDKIRNEIYKHESDKQKYFLSDIINNLFKSVTIITGDPSHDKDHQSRYKKYGINYEFWNDKIKYLITIRNGWDVAHYYLSQEKIKELDKIIGDVFKITRDTILQYVEYLKN